VRSLSRSAIGRILLCAALGSGATGALPRGDETSVRAQREETRTVRPEVGIPARAAIELLRGGRAKEALAKLGEADAVRDKSPYETYLIERLRAQAMAAAGNARGASRAFEKAAALPAAPQSEIADLHAGAAGQYFLAKEFAKCADAAERYFREGGSDGSMRTLYARALYLGGEGARLARAVRADEDAGKRPDEETLRLLADLYARQHDDAQRGEALEKLLVHYPKPEYWSEAIDGLAAVDRFPARLALDAVRLKYVVGALRTADDYVAAERLALQENMPGEAQRVIERGYAVRVLGKGKDAGRHRRLRSLTAGELGEERKRLASASQDSPAAGVADARFDDGLRILLEGDVERGLAMMEQALARGGLAFADDARLRLAYAYYLARRAERSVQVLQPLTQSTDSAVAALARLWTIFLAAHDRSAG
jgi:hypothetical protein